MEAFHCEIVELWAQQQWGPHKRHQATRGEPLFALSAVQIQAISKLMNIGPNNSHSTSILLQDGRSRYPEFIPLISTCPFPDSEPPLLVMELSQGNHNLYA